MRKVKGKKRGGTNCPTGGEKIGAAKIKEDKMEVKKFWRKTFRQM